MKQFLTLLALSAILAHPAFAWAAEPIKIVAAENFYGDIARQIGGPDVTVSSILGNPDQDPHLFEASPSVAREIASARLVIGNGIDYDPWMDKLLRAARSDNRQEIVVANLAGKKPGDNPHIWYDPAIMLSLARTLAGTLSSLDPAHKDDYQQRLAIFEQSLQPIQDKIGVMHARLAGTPVTANEPVFGYMFEALGLQVRNQPFQLAVMNNTEPSASDVAAFENDLKMHQVRLLVYNSQASDPVAVRMEKLARKSQVPVVGATETEPKGTKYQDWMLTELAAIDNALHSAP
jgi:zinc/manganese transport system substrate-binding protein